MVDTTVTGITTTVDITIGVVTTTIMDIDTTMEDATGHNPDNMVIIDTERTIDGMGIEATTATIVETIVKVAEEMAVVAVSVTIEESATKETVTEITTVPHTIEITVLPHVAAESLRDKGRVTIADINEKSDR